MKEFLIGFAILCAYFIVCATTALILRKTVHIPDEVFRKILHFILLSSLFIFVFAFKTWWISALTCGLIIILAYPVLFFFERFKSFSSVMTERKQGEIRLSLIVVFLTFAAVIGLCWGLFRDKVIVLAVIFAWGYGDAAAALIGSKFGKRKIYRKKTLEGTIAMAVTAFVTVFLILILHGIVPWYGTLVTSILVAAAVAVVELFTHDGFDTVTCPLTALVVMIPLLYAFGGILNG